MIGVGTRCSDFTTASKTAFRNPDVRFVNVNVADFDAAKHAGLALVGDARATLERLGEALDGLAGRRRLPRRGRAPERASGTRRSRGSTRSSTTAARAERGDRSGQRRVAIRRTSSSARPERCPATCTSSGARATPRATTSSTATRAWATRSPAGSGVKLAAPEREVYVMVGDGSYLMLSTELVTAVAGAAEADDRAGRQPRLQVDRRTSRVRSGWTASARSTGIARTASSASTARSRPTYLPVDLAANAESLGAKVFRAATLDELRARARGREDGARARS